MFSLQLQATDNDACSPNNIIDYSIEGENVINFDITNNGTLQVCWNYKVYKTSFKKLLSYY